MWRRNRSEAIRSDGQGFKMIEKRRQVIYLVEYQRLDRLSELCSTAPAPKLRELRQDGDP